jgi:DNA-directed RNA polymerase specialized sigma24 family protein
MRDAVRKLSKDARRIAQTWDATEDEDGVLTQYGPPIDLEEFVDPVTTLSTKLAKEQLKLMARDAMDELDEDDQALAQALIIEDVSVREYAARIGKSKSAVSRSYNMLRNDLYSRWIRRTGKDGE